MEIVIPMIEPHWNDSDFTSQLIFLIWTMLVFYTLYRLLKMPKRKKQDERKVKKKLNTSKKYKPDFLDILVKIILFVFLVGFLFTPIHKHIFYMIDWNCNLVSTKTVYIDDTFGTNGISYYNLYTKKLINKSYLIGYYDEENIEFDELVIEVETNVVSHECEIEYYTLSKFLRKIIVIE